MAFFSSLFSQPVCEKCEVIREYNKKHPGDYEYYEDYLESDTSQNSQEAKDIRD